MAQRRGAQKRRGEDRVISVPTALLTSEGALADDERIVQRVVLTTLDDDDLVVG
jgi:hypothetical protein